MTVNVVLRRALAARALAAFALCASSVEAQAAAAGSAYERLLAEQFQAIAFTAEIGGAHRHGRLIRWDGPIRAQIYEGDQYWGEVSPVLRELSRMTGVPISAPPDFAGVNFEIRIVPRGVYRDLAGRSIEDPCLTTVDSNTATGAITYARVLIQSDDPVQRKHCIVEELAQAMGLMDDSSVFRRSVFNDRSRATALTLEDRIMLSVLYDPRLTPNMGVARAMRIAPRIISDLKHRAADRARAAAVAATAAHAR